MKFHTNKDNKNYIMVNIEEKDELINFVVTNNIDIPNEIREEAWYIIRLASDHNMYNLTNNTIQEVALHKDSDIGNYLIEKADFDNILNEDDYIYYEDIVNALNIAIFEDNCKLSNKISRLFREQVYGTKQDLYREYNPEVIDYIKEHNDYNTYRLKFNGLYKPQKYFVYENNTLVEKRLFKKEKTLIKK